MTKLVVNDLIKIFNKCLSAVLPEVLIKNSVKYNKTTQVLSVVDKNYDLDGRNVYVVGFGKAVHNMAMEVEQLLSSKIVKGIISVPQGSLNHSPNGNIKYYQGAENNLPDSQAEDTAKKIKDLVTSLSSKDLLLVLISGGGSALLPLPRKPISLEEKCELIKKLANSGANIKELNTVRKKLSYLKGGGLALQAQPAQVISLILSDIVGNPIDLIASGPTCLKDDTSLNAKVITEKYELFADLPESIKTVLQEDNIVYNKIDHEDSIANYIIGSNNLSIDAGVSEATNLNYLSIKGSNTVTGNVREVAREYVAVVKIIVNLWLNKENINLAEEELRKLSNVDLKFRDLDEMLHSSSFQQNICLIFGGEPTVEVLGKGKGGRNQQLALEFSMLLHQNKEVFKNFEIYFLSAGTDGIDGPTDAAGAIGYIDLVNDASSQGFNVQLYLENNDSYNFYKQFKNGLYHLKSGHTNTNVMDIHIVIIKLKVSKM